MNVSMQFQVGGPLSGIKMLDLSAVLSGPIATVLLADQGAEVIKVESFEGGIIRHLIGSDSGVTPPFLSLNRGKKAVAIDLKSAGGIELVKTIAALSDVIAQNYRPGAVERMGLGYDVMKEIAPALVYCSISGFGPAGL
jgi:crotonobetainyl-CoA:carnitine CoA-transferase CaiB-like acyl-CoA transferase